MARAGDAGDRARRGARERERRERYAAANATSQHAQTPQPDVEPPSDVARRAAATVCAWCGGPITPRSRGPTAKWCSATCRHRAWEQARAAASGRSAVEVVEVVERRVEVPVEVPLTRRDWARVLRELTTQLDDGRVYDRDLAALSAELRALLEAYRRRQYVADASDLGGAELLGRFSGGPP